MPVKKQSEKTTEKYLIKRMRDIGGESSKWVCPGNWGKPDRICEFPGGLVAFVEVKSEGKKPEKHQREEHERMCLRGMLVRVIDTKEAVDQFIEEFKNIDIFYRVGEKYDPIS